MRHMLYLSTALFALVACSDQANVEAAPAPVSTPAPDSTSMASTSATSTMPVADNDWYQMGQQTLAANLAKKPIDKQARNVILFIADGMGPTTVTAARILDGQSKGMSGEENILTFEALPHLALSKTYNTNAQTPDSAGTATAIMTGVKTKIGVLNVSEKVTTGDCASGLANAVPSLGEMAERAGMAVGVVSTARLTHATPATVYAHSASRNWESDVELPARASDCKDIARQLIEFPFGDGLDVAMAGGRRGFLPNTMADPEYRTKVGRRKDGRDLTAEWQAKSNNHQYVWNMAGFEAANTQGKLLGLFEPSHMQYEADRAGDTGGEPSLAQMTAKAIDILGQDDDGFFLMVEGGRVDHAHHAGNAYRALLDVQALDEAVRVALEKTDNQETLIIVTADHGHTLSLQGYPKRGNPILGLTVPVNRNGTPANKPALAADGKPYTTLNYANGPGTIFGRNGEAAERPEVSDAQAQNQDYKQMALIPLGSETHGGQDVIIFAGGPQAWLFDGVVEENYIFHVMEYALGLNKRLDQDKE